MKPTCALLVAAALGAGLFAGADSARQLAVRLFDGKQRRREIVLLVVGIRCGKPQIGHFLQPRAQGVRLRLPMGHQALLLNEIYG